MPSVVRRSLIPSLVILLFAVFTTALVAAPMRATASSTLIISEVAPWSSGNSPIGADWFEVTNTDTVAVDITGWKVDDSSASFASAIALTGVTSIGPGESVIFMETANLAASKAAFLSLWFGANPPAGLQIGAYSGSGIGLSTGGDAVNLYNAAGVLQAGVSFGASPPGPSFPTFNNAAGIDGAAISELSALGVSAAFLAAGNASEIGSPGVALNRLIVSEIAPWSSGNSPIGADWFEVTNTDTVAVDITGWKVDDSSASFAFAIALTGVTSIGPGESVIFMETANLAASKAAFLSLWFGANPPAGLQIGAYSGSGIGLSTGGDAVNLYNAAGVPQAGVSFGASPPGPSFPTFNNRAGLNGVVVSALSIDGVDAAQAVNDPLEIGSPGTLAKPNVVITPPPAPVTVKINEVESSGGTPGDWVELVNTGAAAVNLSGFLFGDSSNTYVIPGGTSIAPGAFLVIDEATFGFGLGSGDSARLLRADGTTVVDTYTWTQHAATTYGRCPDGTGSFVTTLASSKGGPNVCLSSVPAEVWPGGPTVTTVDDVNAFAANGSGGTNMSGLVYEPSGTNEPGILWAVQNGPGTMYRLVWSGGKWIPDTSNGWSAGKVLHYSNGTGDVDAEGVTFTSAGPAAGMYVASERNNLNNTVSKLAVLRYDVSGAAVALSAAQEWDLTANLPAVGANLGLEAITWVPDSFLTARGFFDDAKGHVYNPADYPKHGNGLFFVGVEASGLVYAFALNTDGTFNRVSTVVTGFTGVMDLRFDAYRGDFWVVCDNTCEGRASLMTIGPSGAFGIAHLYERPAGMGNLNNEGFTTASDAECVNGLKPAFWSDDNNTGGHALRAGTVPCSLVAASLTPVTGGASNNGRGRTDQAEGAGRSGAYRIGAACGGGTLASAFLNGVAVSDAQVVFLTFNPKQQEPKLLGNGTWMFHDNAFTLRITCDGAGGTAGATVAVERAQ